MLKRSTFLHSFLLWALLEGLASGSVYHVTSGGDTPYPPVGTTPCTDGPTHCTLREAIIEGNNHRGPHTITFSVLKVTLANGGGLVLKAPFLISGSAISRTIIDGNNNSCFTLDDASTLANAKGANGTVISDLVIQGCNGDAISGNGHGFKILNNYIGTDASGTSASAATANSGSGISVSASHVYTAIDSDSKVNTFLSGVYGSFPGLPDVTLPDVSGQINTFSGNLVTTLAALTDPIFITGNVISGNTQNGIEVFSENLAGVIIAGNMIGTNATGTKALPNGQSGIRFSGSTFGNLIGPGNVISGNTQHGIRMDASAVLLPNFVMGNRIGLGTAASAHVGNKLSGIWVSSITPSSEATKFNATSLSVVIGPQNLIGDNQGANNNAFPDTLGADDAGIVITGTSTKVKVIGNTIGIGEFDGTPVASRDYGNAGDGIIVSSSENVIGGSSPAEANTIAGNARHGIVVKVASTRSTRIAGNYIGVYPGLAGNLTLGNGTDGVHIDGANATTVGGTGATERNIIAANKRHGIALRNGGLDNGWANLFQRNQLYHNAALAIDLEHPANAADDPSHTPYPQNYANLDQNPPAICVSADGYCAGFTAPSSTDKTTKLDWTLVAKPSTSYRLEFFKIDAASLATATSMTFLGEQTISADASGKLAGCSSKRCSSTIAAGSAGAYVVMTATDVTKVIVGADSPSWLSLLSCFALESCTTDSTSELSNVAQPTALGPEPAAPTVATAPATDVLATAATFHGTVSANLLATTVQFAYGLTTAYGSTAVAEQSPLPADASDAPVSATVRGLACGSTYHFRAEATNARGTSKGEDQTFATLACGTGPDAGPGPGVDAGAGLDAGPGSSSSGCTFAGSASLQPSGLTLLLVALALALLKQRR